MARKSWDASCALLSRLFSASHLQKLAWEGVSDLVPFALNCIGQRERPHRTLGGLLDQAFEILRRNHPVEYVFKACLLRRRLFGTHSPRTTSAYLEWPIGEARADMLLVNGRADVYEIKSCFDSPARIDSQLREYYRCFTRVTVVSDASGTPAYLNQLPEHVGVATLTPRFSISVKREPKPLYDHLEHVPMVRLLCQPERDKIAAELGVDMLSAEGAYRYRYLLKKIRQSLSVRDVHKRVTNALRERSRTKRRAAYCDYLPDSLHVAAFAYRLRKSDWEALFSVLRADPSEMPTHRSPHVFPVSAG